MKRHSFTEDLAAFFKARPYQWINARDLEFAGRQAWRTRVSDCRALGMTIENRQRMWHDPLRVRPSFTISEYRFVPPAPKDLIEVAEQACNQDERGV